MIYDTQSTVNIVFCNITCMHYDIMKTLFPKKIVQAPDRKTGFSTIKTTKTPSILKNYFNNQAPVV